MSTRKATKQKQIKRSFVKHAVKQKIEAVAEPRPEEKKSSASIQLVRGMRDVLPKDQPWWEWLRGQVRDTAHLFSFQRIDTPVVEYVKLYERPLGPTSDVVSKEMFTFVDRSRDRVALRPEWTAGIARAYLEHGMQSLPQPVRLMTLGPLFRYERPQAGRYRQHHQIDFEIIGDDNPVSDALVILCGHHFYTSLGLPVEFKINSLGCPNDREVYREQLVNFLKPSRRELCEDCQMRLQKNPLRVLDCKEPNCRNLIARAPQIIEHLCEPCREHLMSVLEYLDEANVSYEVVPTIVRGFDYYTRTIFEVFPVDNSTKEKKENAEAGEERPRDAIGGGGRYDNLIELLGGRATPAVGMGVGMERTIKALKEQGIEPPRPLRPDVFLAQLGETARKAAFGLYLELRRAGFIVAEEFTKAALRDQLGKANQLAAPFTVIVGHKEIVDGTVIIRDMANGVQEVVDRKKVVAELEKRLDAQLAGEREAVDTGTQKPVQ